MQDEQALRDEIEQSRTMALIQQAQENDAIRQWKEKNGKHFTENQHRIKKDSTTKLYQLTNGQQQQVNSFSQAEAEVQANIAQCDGERLRRNSDGKKEHYQQDRFAAMLMPLINQLTSQELIDLAKQSFRELGNATAALQNGCTATLCIVKDRGDGNGKRAIFIWLGDSRAAVFQNGVVSHTTWDHHPAHALEAARIKQVIPEFDPAQQKRLQTQRITRDKDGKPVSYQTSLALSRSFGNKDFVGSSHEPSATVVTLDDEHAKIILASDGVWDKVGANDDMQAILRQDRLTDLEKVDRIRQLAYQRGVYDYYRYKNYIPDNITIMMAPANNGVYLVLDGHGAAETCVDIVANGNAHQASLLQVLSNKITLAVAHRTNSQPDELPASLELTPSLSQSYDDEATTIEFDQNCSPPEQAEPVLNGDRQQLCKSGSNIEFERWQSAKQASSSAHRSFGGGRVFAGVTNSVPVDMTDDTLAPLVDEDQVMDGQNHHTESGTTNSSQRATPPIQC